MEKYFTIFIIMSVAVMGCQKAPQETPQQAAEKGSAPEAAKEISNAPAQPPPQVQTDKNSEKESAPFQPFYVYATKAFAGNHFIPSGYMPNSNCVKLKDDWAENCRGEGTCIRVDYDVECSRKDEKWAGVYWLNQANNWGSRKGGFNLTGARRLTFWARGERGGEQIQEFTVGGITGDYPDSDTAVIGPVILGAEWKQYTIDVRGKDLSYISGGFAWATSEEVNPEQCTFYLDDIKYE